MKRKTTTGTGKGWKKNRKATLFMGLTLVLAGALLGFFFLEQEQEREPRPIPQERIWAVVQERAAEHDLDPAFIFALVFAESSFDAHAANGVARGLMQLTPPAWETISDLSFNKAWQWETNIEAGVAYLGFLRDFLVQHETFSYPLLAASYVHGPFAVKRVDFDVNRLPPLRNNVYREFLAGNPHPIEVPGGR